MIAVASAVLGALWLGASPTPIGATSDGRGLGAALLMTLAVLAVVPAQRATAMGMYQAVYAIGMITGPIMAGAVADSAGIEAVFYLSAAVALAGGALVFMGRIPKTTD
ncbi:MAG: MFS transporter [Chloroflexi bacterium]|nr:MFS transporter [Chloroflexota bacterium]